MNITDPIKFFVALIVISVILQELRIVEGPLNEENCTLSAAVCGERWVGHEFPEDADMGFREGMRTNWEGYKLHPEKRPN